MVVSIDPIKVLAGIGAVLLMVGVMPFTPAAVGALILLSLCSFEIRWSN